MSLHDAVMLTIDARFRGPPGSGNGGYVCGVIGTALNQLVTVRLNRPVPLDEPLALVHVEPQLWQLQHQGQALAEARPAALELQPPAPPSYVQALEASLHHSGFHDHPAPGCFVCGYERRRGDGLRLFAAVVPGAQIAAAAWLPDASLAGPDGKVAPEFMAAALDCPGWFALIGATPGRWLLGEFTARVDRCVHVDEPCVVVGWKLGSERRKHTVGTAVFDEDGELAAVAKGVWIEPRPPVQGA
jgi:hypothetical protein